MKLRGPVGLVLVSTHDLNRNKLILCFILKFLLLRTLKKFSDNLPGYTMKSIHVTLAVTLAVILTVDMQTVLNTS